MKQAAVVGMVVGLGMLAPSQPVAAQPAGLVPHIAVIAPLSPPPAPNPSADAFRQGLRDLGYVDGQNILVVYRWAGGRLDRMAELSAKVIALRPAVIVVAGTGWAGAAKRATSTIPIVMATGGTDPVATGVVASLARPGGNVTGLTMMNVDLSAKRVQLVKDTVVGLVRVAVFVPPGAPPEMELLLQQTDEAARSAGLQPYTVRVDGADLETAFRTAARERVGAAILLQSPFFANEKVRITELALKYRLPTMAGEPGFAEAGGLMTYGPNIPDLWRRAASYVDRILKGAKPGDLPIEQPTKFELSINLRTARALELAIPPSVLLRADNVIE